MEKNNLLDNLEFLTEKGWKIDKDITSQSKFASYDFEKKSLNFEISPIFKTCDYNGHFFNLIGKSTDCLLHPKQQLYCSFKNNEFDLYDIDKIPLKQTPLKIKTACINDQSDYDIPDSVIKLTAWLITDGSVFQGLWGTSYALFQSEGKHLIIENLLNINNISYVKKERKRNIQEICGKKLIKEPKISYEYYISQGSFLENYVFEKYNFPFWLSFLSKRQFDIFLESFILGDGSKHKNAQETSWMAYGTKNVLNQLQYLCFLNGHTTSLYVYRNNQYRLNIRLNIQQVQINRFANALLTHNNIKVKIPVINTSNNTLIIRNNGKISIIGSQEAFVLKE